MNGRQTVSTSNGLSETYPVKAADKLCTCNCTCRRRKTSRKSSRAPNSEAFSLAAEDIQVLLSKDFGVHQQMGGQAYEKNNVVDQANYRPVEKNTNESAERAERAEENETRQRAENILTALSELSQLRFRGQELSRLIDSLQESKINLQERLTTSFQKPSNFPPVSVYRQQPVQFLQPDSTLTQRSELPLTLPSQAPPPPPPPPPPPLTSSSVATTAPGIKQPVFSSPRLQSAVRQQAGICPVNIKQAELPGPETGCPRLPNFGSMSIRERKASLSENRQNLISEAFIGRIRERIRERRQQQQAVVISEHQAAAAAVLPLTQQSLHVNFRPTTTTTTNGMLQEALIGAPSQGDKGLPFHRRFSSVGNNSQSCDASEPPPPSRNRRHSAEGVNRDQEETAEAGEPAVEEEVAGQIALLTTLAQISLRASPPPPPAPTLPRALLPVKPQSERLLPTTSEHLSAADVKAGGDSIMTDRHRHPAANADDDDQPVYHKFSSLLKWNYLAADAADSRDRLGKAAFQLLPPPRRGASQEDEEEEETVKAEGKEDACHVNGGEEGATREADTAVAERPPPQKRVLFSSQEHICVDTAYESNRVTAPPPITTTTAIKIKPAIKKFPRTTERLNGDAAGCQTQFKGDDAIKRCGTQRSVAWVDEVINQACHFNGS